jgi:hypothetical protein
MDVFKILNLGIEFTGVFGENTKLAHRQITT